MVKYTDLNGKVAVVTGAAKGIGKAIAIGLAQQGVKLVLCKHRSDILEVEREVAAAGAESITLQVDMRDVDSIGRMMEQAIRTYGKIDILINNAGINIPQEPHEVTEENWDRILDTNLKGVFFCCQKAGESMRAQRAGKIVNIASDMGLVGYRKRAAYCSSKGGVVQLTKALAIDWAPYNIQVNAIAPTFVHTDLTENMFKDRQFYEDVLNRIPMRELPTAEDVMHAALYLSSDVSRFVTGHTLPVDGGWIAW
jgi:2-deoxy-D-gluconate 3-dehydrogenase